MRSCWFLISSACPMADMIIDDIEKTVMKPLDPGADGENVDTLLEELHTLHELGVSEVHGRFPDMHDLKRIEIFGERVIPVAAAF